MYKKNWFFEELAKLGIDVAILGADVSASKIIAAAIAAAKTYKEV